jgi:hypothetical protein
MNEQVAKSCPFMIVGAKALYGLFLSLILFRLTAPSLQSGVVEPYPVHATWFPSCLPLVETGRI